MAKASIIIPCYNAESFLRETVASAQAQTVQDIEIICVDDGSADSTLEVLNQLAASDERIRVLSQENGGEGPARDAGLSVATGEWLYFLDSDDLMMPTLLEQAIAQGEVADADIVIFRTMMLDDKTGEQSLCEWSFKRTWLDTNTFDPHDYPEYILDSFQNWVHNKLFRGSFVREHHLRMQHVHRTADLLFTCRALTEAQRITLLDSPLYHYRVNNAQSAMATSDQYPLDFYHAFVALKAALIEDGTWELYHDSFVNWAIEGIAVNLRFSRNYQTFCAIANELTKQGFDELDITNFPREKAHMSYYYDQLRPLIDGSPNETLFNIAASYRMEHADVSTGASFSRMRIAELEAQLCARDRELTSIQEELNSRVSEIERLRAELDELHHAFTCVTESVSFKAGRAVTFAPRKMAQVAKRIARKRNL